MKLLPLAAFLSLGVFTAAPLLAQNAQQIMNEAQTAYIRGDLAAAKKGFETVVQIDPRNTVANNYLRMIKAQEAKAPKGNETEAKLAKVILPKVELREATLGSVLDFLKQNTTKVSGGKESVNFVMQLSPEQVSMPITLVLTNVPLTEVLKYIGTLANVKFEYDKYAVRVRPAGGGPAQP